MTYGDAQGYRGLRELICHKYELFEAFKAEPENIIVSTDCGMKYLPRDVADGSSGTVVRVDPQSKVVLLDDGRMYRVTPNTVLRWKAVEAAKRARDAR